MSLIPPQFLFRWSLPVRHVAALPRSGQHLLKLPATCTLPEHGSLDPNPRFGELRVGWNAEGIGFSVNVSGKRRPPRCDQRLPLESDGLQLWIDTRNTQTIHRASRFCHHFCALPTGGEDGASPVVRQFPIARAREEATLAEPDQFAARSEIRADGYLLEVWLPAEVLHGYDPETNPRLGFYYALRDGELGEQYLAVGPEFPFAYDPSLWWTLELT